MTQVILNNSNYSNKSTGKLGTVSTFGTSKFTSEQMVERLKEHARAITLGTITLPQMVQNWKERYNIDISVPSEKEFRVRNREKIEKIALEMIESGEMSVPSLGADAVQAAVVGKLMVSKTLVAQMQKAVGQVIARVIDAKGASAGASGIMTVKVKDKLGKPGSRRVKTPMNGSDLDTFVKLYKIVTDDYRADLSLVVEAAKVRKIVTKTVDAEVDKKVASIKEKLLETQFDPNMEVTEEMRAQYESTEVNQG